MKTLWHWFTNRVMSDFYTYEERELIAQQARQLKLENDEREEKLKADSKFKLKAIARIPHRYKEAPADTLIYLEQSKLERQIRAGATRYRNTHKVIGELGLNSFIRSTEIFVTALTPWYQGQISLEEAIARYPDQIKEV